MHASHAAPHSDLKICELLVVTQWDQCLLWAQGVHMRIGESYSINREILLDLLAVAKVLMQWGLFVMMW